ncbi:VOC family protein [Moheibacter sediminis]|uniref:Uncharacterized conserved protein PhnB, glyoxalase superfamily n=1 Tax=Moheibacter sediminis TaxID=1434700 RepID=A0A1W1Z969_9FLAO|nr:VOC family protein [Moheibacter sediminis]SMC44980.1 Uncharacterized conserved protein PhnB, glyoxalase superfamily [Moheibacter sediminis]
MNIKNINFIIYVENQEISTDFYKKLFRKEPVLNVPGMTEFELNDNCKLGLMPNAGMAAILNNQTPHPNEGTGIPRCELYFYITDIEDEFKNAIEIGAKLISHVSERNWGDKACYFTDPDGHIIAFAEKINLN